MAQPTVILRHCENYNVSRIRTLAREGLDTLNLRPFGRTLIKPNVVASGDIMAVAGNLDPTADAGADQSVNEGDIVKVKCLAIEDRGKIRLSMKNIDQETGEELVPADG